MIYLLAVLAILLVVSVTVTTLATLNDTVLEAFADLEGWPLRIIMLLICPWALLIEASQGRGWSYAKSALKAIVRGERVDREY